MSWICIKDFPEDLFIVKEDAWKAGKIFNRWTITLENIQDLWDYFQKKILLK